MAKWSKWRPFPNPRLCEYLVAPFGPGVYELKHRVTGRRILFGRGRNLAHRMCSLLPASRGGCGTRRNFGKRNYVSERLNEIVYRTMACASHEEAVAAEQLLRRGASAYEFST